MKTLTIRHVPRQLAAALDRERRRRDQSLNATVIDVLSRGLGVSAEGPPTNGLARLGGTWTADEFAEFEAAVQPFEAVDAEMWS